MGAIIGLPQPIQLGTVPRRLSTKIPRPNLAWSSAMRTGVTSPYDYARQAITAAPIGTSLVEQRIKQHVGLHRTATTTVNEHANGTGTFNTATHNVVVHAVLSILDCGTNTVNYQFRGAANSGGITYAVGIAVNTNGLAGVRAEGGGTSTTTYLSKAYCNGRTLCVSAVEIGQDVYFFADGYFVGSATHAYPARTIIPTARLVMSNQSGSEPTLAVLQYANFIVPSNGYALAKYLSESPDRLWDAESMFAYIPAKIPTLSLPTLTSVGTTTARPRVSLTF